MEGLSSVCRTGNSTSRVAFIIKGLYSTLLDWEQDLAGGKAALS